MLDNLDIIWEGPGILTHCEAHLREGKRTVTLTIFKDWDKMAIKVSAEGLGPGMGEKQDACDGVSSGQIPNMEGTRD